MSKFNKSEVLDDVYARQADIIIKMMEEVDANDFKLPWNKLNLTSRNIKTGTKYSLSNVLVLSLLRDIFNYETPFWGTYRQFKEAGVKVKDEAFKSETQAIVVFSAPRYTEKSGKKGLVPRSVDLSTLAQDDFNWVRRYTKVYNLDQTENWQDVPGFVDRVNAFKDSNIKAVGDDSVCRFDNVDDFINRTKATINVSDVSDAYYVGGKVDAISMPRMERFKIDGADDVTAAANYYSTLLHELTHWTGHNTRLDRDMNHAFGDKKYAFEELVAEFGSAFLCDELEVTQMPREDHAIYLKSWIKLLKDDPNALSNAAAKAQRAVKFLIELQSELALAA